jgi:S-methyl-5-thioribose-1-phosphate isomerase
MLVNGQHHRTVWMEKDIVRMINQPLIPHKFEIFDSRDYKQTADAISTMIVRGAPAIGGTGAFGLAQAALQIKEENFDKYMEKINEARELLLSTRPTACDLSYGLEFVLNRIKKSESLENARQEAVKAANEYADWSANTCEKIGGLGSELIKDNSRILTHCNAGWLACVDWGTALSPIFHAKRQGKKIFVYVDETRPRCQGARLTAWELVNEGIDHAVIADNAAGYYMKKGEVDMIIVGSDRIVAKDGSVANKIGTYKNAVLAKENGIPFYVAAPTSTIDFELESGDQIPIEERHEDEVLHMFGLGNSGGVEKIRIAPEGSRARNPAFDVTPAKYITGIITEKGIFKPTELMQLR